MPATCPDSACRAALHPIRSSPAIGMRSTQWAHGRVPTARDASPWSGQARQIPTAPHLRTDSDDSRPSVVAEHLKHAIAGLPGPGGAGARNARRHHLVRGQAFGDGFRLLTPLVGQLTPGVATVTKRLGFGVTHHQQHILVILGFFRNLLEARSPWTNAPILNDPAYVPTQRAMTIVSEQRQETPYQSPIASTCASRSRSTLRNLRSEISRNSRSSSCSARSSALSESISVVVSFVARSRLRNA